MWNAVVGVGAFGLLWGLVLGLWHLTEKLRSKRRAQKAEPLKFEIPNAVPVPFGTPVVLNVHMPRDSWYMTTQNGRTVVVMHPELFDDLLRQSRGQG